ncbi:MAG: hypothetical protein HC814_01250 [Rhodobacteraceae bacterium]|nr:hypothetical protein [Paracoccaceae bacterium]
MTLGFLVAPLILIAIGYITYRSLEDYSAAADEVARSYRVLSRLNGALLQLASAESEARGYALNGDEEAREDYLEAAQSVAYDIDRLKELAIDPRILRMIGEFERRAAERLERVEIIVHARIRGGLAAVPPLVGPGRDLMEWTRAIGTEIDQLERKLLVERTWRANAHGRRAILVIVLGSIFAVGTAIAGSVLLTRELRHRQRLENRVIEVREREQHRIGQDLHDGVCQQLTGITLMSRSVEQKLAARAAPETAALADITRLINDSLDQVRQIARGLRPVPEGASGLMIALKELAEQVTRTGQIACRFVCPEPVPLPDPFVAEHLFRISQEAIQNAVRHANAKVIEVGLTSNEDSIHLKVSDDGCGLDPAKVGEGVGLGSMRYRARAIGAGLDVRSDSGHGAIISCSLPRSSLN